MGKNKKKESKDIEVNIRAIHGFLNDEKSLAVATVSWNGGPDKLNIRNCFISADGGLQLRKGVSLTEEEVDALTDILVERRKHGLPKTTKDGKKAVNFNDIFDATTEIVERRDAGYTTEDVFIKLRTKPGVKINGG